MHRFYIPGENFTSPTITITDKSELHHIRNVLRLKNNDEVCAFNGVDKEIQGKITNITSRAAQIAVENIREEESPSPKIILACAIPKKSKFEFLIEKTTELGVSEIIPLLTQRTEVRAKGAKIKAQQQRFQTIAINAAKQSQRITIPIIHEAMLFPDIFDQLPKETNWIIPSLEEEKKSLQKALQKLKSPESLGFLIGPEGDFTPEEYDLAKQRGATAVTLGPNVLKVETAALSVLSFASLYYFS